MRQHSPQTIREPEAPTLQRRYRQRFMHALGASCNSLQKVAAMLRHRYRSEEAAETIEASLEMLLDCRSPADARDVLGQIIEERVVGTIKPPQLEVRIHTAISALFDASLQASDWPASLIVVAEQVAGMMDPYDAARGDVTRLPTGAYVIVIGEAYQGGALMPAASHSNVVASPSEPPMMSKRTRRSSAGKVSSSELATGTSIGSLV